MTTYNNPFYVWSTLCHWVLRIIFSYFQNYPNYEHLVLKVKEETYSEIEDVVNIRQRAERTNKPRRKSKANSNKCVQVLDNLIQAMKPLVRRTYPEQSYWFFGKHVTERLNCMRDMDAKCASRDIMNLLTEWSSEEIFLKPGTSGMTWTLGTHAWGFLTSLSLWFSKMKQCWLVDGRNFQLGAFMIQKAWLTTWFWSSASQSRALKWLEYWCFVNNQMLSCFGSHVKLHVGYFCSW